MRRLILGTALSLALVGLAPLPASAAAGGTELINNESLQPGESIASGNSVAVMQTDGNFVVYQGGVAQFSSNTFNAPGSHLVQQGDGNAVVYNPNGQALWNSGTPNMGGDHLVIQSDGNLVEYAGNRALWSIRTGAIGSPPPPQGGDTLRPGQTLNPNESLNSNGFHAVMQSDGNFVLYGEGKALFQTATSGPGRLVMQSDGNLVLYNTSNQALFNTGTGSANSHLTLQSDGNLVVYSPNRATWSRLTGRIASRSIPGDGTFRVPQDVPYGIYSTNGASPPPPSFGCYWETDNKDGGIILNDFTPGPTFFTLGSDVASVRTQGCATFFQQN